MENVAFQDCGFNKFSASIFNIHIRLKILWHRIRSCSAGLLSLLLGYGWTKLPPFLLQLHLAISALQIIVDPHSKRNTMLFPLQDSNANLLDERGSYMKKWRNHHKEVSWCFYSLLAGSHPLTDSASTGLHFIWARHFVSSHWKFIIYLFCQVSLQ